MYDDSTSQITPSQAMILDAMERIHQPVSRFPTMLLTLLKLNMCFHL
jgi:hypothetical protein